ncbi:ADP-glyceromanno-heptose 6-epimerase [Methylobacterium sp. SyP6R]|uniref:ADP-glyceromanno-heptose 6-epimerase n=1 Tax=Methylobacterium sp. SyP6R TaxID=2718876 RepID=UPI001F006C80|nr:ADP-glyceromanno-heptose 6-epimerase [Methylobacterium sp. SyP6R]MCF4129623.1 ADP-glyceromanno-heptose 6-epimerase [Methylobacterium sp. SyP6R]
MIVVTGAAGFIGSNVVASLNERGIEDVLVCDRLGSDGRWRNLRDRAVAAFVAPEELFERLRGRRDIEQVIHLGAVASTLETDADRVMAENYHFSLRLIDWCTEAAVPIVYASSAATYGDGAQGFDDDPALAALRRLRPLNLYAWSKHQLDLAMARRRETGAPLPPRCIGLKFFNVFGPNEYHKGAMASLVTQVHPQVRAGETISLFASHRPTIPDGGQRRDFVPVAYAVDVLLWLMEGPVRQGLFNVGTGRARSFADLARAVFAAEGKREAIAYRPMPEALRDVYQYVTEASTGRLRAAGWSGQAPTLEDSVSDYVASYLRPLRYR